MENPESDQQAPGGANSVILGRNYKKWLISALALVLVAAIAGGTYFYFRPKLKQAKPNNTSAKTDPSQIVQVINPELPAQGYEKTIYDAEQLYTQADYNGAIKILAASEPRTTDSQQLYMIRSKLGYSYRAKNDWKNAIQWFEKAQATGLKESDSLYPLIAEMAEKLGNKPKAIAAYKKAYDLLASNNNSVAQRVAGQYQEKIISLGGQ